MATTQTKRRVLLVGLGLLLAVSLTATMVVVGADRTVLDAEFAKETASDDEVSAMIDAELRSVIEDEVGAEAETYDISRERIIDESLEEAELETQIAGVIDQFYAAIHGNGDPVLEVDTVSMKDGYESAVASELRREGVLAAHLPEIDGTDVSPMLESEAAYRETREEVAVPLGQEDQAAQELRDELAAELENESLTAPEREATMAYGEVYIESLVYYVTYEEFRAAEHQERTTLADTVAGSARAELDETYTLTDDDGDFATAVETMQMPVSIATTLSSLLPIVSVGLAGLIGWASISRSTALYEIGGISAVVGAASYLAVGLAVDEAASELTGAIDDPERAALVLGVVTETAAVFESQATILVGIGAVAIGLGWAIRTNLVSIADVPGEDATAASPTAPDGDVVEYDETASTRADGESESDPESDEDGPDEDGPDERPAEAGAAGATNAGADAADAVTATATAAGEGDGTTSSDRESDGAGDADSESASDTAGADERDRP